MLKSNLILLVQLRKIFGINEDDAKFDELVDPNVSFSQWHPYLHCYNNIAMLANSYRSFCLHHYFLYSRVSLNNNRPLFGSTSKCKFIVDFYVTLGNIYKIE